MNLQLYMASGTRKLLLARHDFYVEQTDKRVLAHFQDIEAEASRYGEGEFLRLSSMLDDGTRDEGDVAEAADYRAQEFYSLLSDLKDQTLLGSLAGLYHQWEKDLREFIEWELNHYADRREVRKVAWGSNLGDVLGLIQDFGWTTRSEPFFPDVDACRLIVNVYKHGQGHALNQLAERFPEFVARPFYNWPAAFSTDFLDHEWLKVTPEQFSRIAGALRAFWTVFPERLLSTGVQV